MFDCLSIRKNIILLVITPCLIGMIVLSAYYVIDKMNNVELNLRQQATLLVSSIEVMLSDKYLDNMQLIEQQLSQFHRANSSLLAIAIIDQNNLRVTKLANDHLFESRKRTEFPTKLNAKTINQQLYITAPIQSLKRTTQSNLNSYYLSLILDKHALQLPLYKSLLVTILIVTVVLSLSLIIALYISKQFDELNTSLTLVKENMQSNITQATAELTQTLETIEVQNIEIDFARKQAIKINRVKSEFLANISHEIRTPMNGVIGFTHLLLKSNIDELQKDYLVTIQNSANQLLSIIEDILDFSKIEAGKMKLDSVPFSFHDCIEEVITLLSTESIKKRIELIPLIYKNVPDLMLGDPTRVRQVLTNLISNAIKFTEKGSIIVRVLVEENSTDRFLIRTTITDTGMGMTDEQIGKLFQPFSQVNQQINRHHSGTGLGLVISKKLIEQMGGTISIESKSNEGTSFSFTFCSLNPSGQNLNLSSDLTNKIDLSEQQVYLFDYHPMALLAKKHLLLSWSMEVSTFQNIDKLIRTIELLTTHSKTTHNKPIVIIGLPNESNDFINKFKDIINTKKYSSKIQGILMIGHLESHYKNKPFMKNALLHYLEKPLTRKQLKNSFERMGLLSSEDTKNIKVESLHQSFSGLRILVVDDNPDNLKLITIVLEEMQVEVTQAYDGLSAIELCRDEHFDLIFMDIRMPGIDGVESSKRIHNHHLNSSTPIIALTAHAMVGEKEQLLKSGLQDFMTKPISSVQLNHLISQWTEQSLTPHKNQVSEPGNIQPDYENFSSINWKQALDITAGREDIALELFKALYLKIPDFKQQLRSVSDISMNELLSSTHKFHGLTCYTGVPQLQLLTRRLEQEIKNERPVEELKASIALLLTEIENVEQAAIDYIPKEDCSIN